MTQDLFELPGAESNSIVGSLVDLGNDPLGFLTRASPPVLTTLVRIPHQQWETKDYQTTIILYYLGVAQSNRVWSSLAKFPSFQA